MSITPRGLPKARRQLLRHLDDPTSALRSGAGDHNQGGLNLLASHLRAAELYWVSADMAALAVSSGGQLAAARWATADRPAPCGLMWWGDGIGQITRDGLEVPVDAVCWGPDSDSACQVSLLIDRRRLAEKAVIAGGELLADQVPPLMPMWSADLPVTSEPTSMADLPPEIPPAVAGALAAAWLLMQQPQMVDRTREPASSGEARSAARSGLPAPDVTVIDLRRQYIPQDQDPDVDSGSRRYRHRWVVSGHWRNQPYGRGRSLRRQTWIPAYVKGPEGAPLLATERVNVWRR